MVESFVAFGLTHGLSQRGPSGGGLQAFGGVAQRVVAKRLTHAQGTTHPRTHQGFHGVKSSLAE